MFDEPNINQRAGRGDSLENWWDGRDALDEASINYQESAVLTTFRMDIIG